MPTSPDDERRDVQQAPKVLALNLAVFSAVQSGLTLAVRKYRGTGTDDISTNMIGMFGAGGALSLCTNLVGDQPAAPGQTKPTTPGGIAADAVRTGALFAALNGAFMKVGQMFSNKNPSEDVYYYHTVGMLNALGLEKYEKNFERGLLTDDWLAAQRRRAAGGQGAAGAEAEDPQLRRAEQGGAGAGAGGVRTAAGAERGRRRHARGRVGEKRGAEPDAIELQKRKRQSLSFLLQKHENVKSRRYQVPVPSSLRSARAFHNKTRTRSSAKRNVPPLTSWCHFVPSRSSRSSRASRSPP